MTTVALKPATQIAIGKETTRGTSVARTRRILTQEATYRIIEEEEQFEDHMHGTIARASEEPVTTRHHTELELPMPLDFEQILLALLSGVQGGVTPTTVAWREGSSRSPPLSGGAKRTSERWLLRGGPHLVSARYMPTHCPSRFT